MSKRPSTADRNPSVTDSGDADPFLSRWARRKALVRSGADPDAAAESSADRDALAKSAPASADALPEGGESQAPEPTDEDMPPLESIDENTDMSGFFSSKVSQAVKKAALRKFFHNPAFNVVDGLDDYDDDFRSFQALGDIVTSDMRSQMDREAERDRESAARAEDIEQGSESPVPEQARSEEAGEPVTTAEPVTGDDDDADADAQTTADAEPGVTREPGHQARIRHGKLRPRGAAADDA